MKAAAKKARAKDTRPELKVIEGALSIYRPGDVIAFDLDGMEFKAPVKRIEMRGGGKTYLFVTVDILIAVSNVKRVERKGRRGASSGVACGEKGGEA